MYLLCIMKYIIKLLRTIFQKDSPKPMGRWNIDYCVKKINHKVDLSNVDHCGPCGQYIIPKNHSKNESKKNESKK